MSIAEIASWAYPKMFDGTPYRDELRARLSTIRRILDVGDPVPPSAGPNISREVRGLAVLLLFASYENLLTSLCRGLLETASKLRVGNRRLKTGFRQFAVHGLFDSIRGASEKKLWKETGRKLLEQAFSPRACTIDAAVFPTDGSFMKCSQVSLMFDIFELGDPGPILKEIWARLDTIVVERNNIAHGKSAPEDIGRGYTSQEIRDLVDLWDRRWIELIDYVEARAASRDFYRAK